MTIRGVRGADHVAFTVPDLDEATRFFTDVLGFELLYRAGPFADADGEAMERTLGVDRRAVLTLAMLRLGTTQVELLEWDGVAAVKQHPRNSDAGAAHLAVHVDDIDASVAELRAVAGVEVMRAPTVVSEGPTTRLRYVYFRTRWGLQLERVTPPHR